MKQFTIFIAFLLLVVQVATAQTPYEKTINTWHQQRMEELKGPTGWLNLAGLYWLEEGSTSFGSDSSNRWVYKGAAAAKAGRFVRTGKQVDWYTQDGALVLLNGQPVTTTTIFHPDSLRGPLLTLGSLNWYVMKREDKIGVRLRDLQHPAVAHFTGVDRFPVDSSWRVRAQLLPPLQTGIAITNVLGQTSQQKTPGQLRFTIDGVQYTLDALQEGDQLFIIFGDKTSGLDTYPSGRFLYAPLPGPDGFTVLDFNKAINPPCAFTPYATCPLPPRQNILRRPITAGEKNYHY